MKLLFECHKGTLVRKPGGGRAPPARSHDTVRGLLDTPYKPQKTQLYQKMTKGKPGRLSGVSMRSADVNQTI